MKAVVSAAGEGVRMSPLTRNRSKHMLPVGGKPILHHVLETIKRCGIKEILMVVGYKKEVIRDYFQDGTDMGLRITYLFQERALGTASAVILAEDHVNEDFLGVNGDLLFTDEALRTLLKAHKGKPAATIASAKVDEPSNYGMIERDGDRVTRLVEKPRSDDVSNKLANTGMYVFSPEIFKSIKEISRSIRGEYELTDAIMRLIEKGNIVKTAEIQAKDWFDVGRPWDLLEANRRAILQSDFRIEGIVEEGVHLVGPVKVGRGARVRSGAYVEGPSIIGDESDVGPNCYIRFHTTLGKGTRIGNACEVKNSLIMDGTHVGHLSYIGDSVIGSECNLGAGTLLGNLRLDDKTVKVKVRDRVIDSGRRKLGAIIGDKVKTGINASLMPGVKVGNNSWVGPGVVLHEDLPDDVVIFQKQSFEVKPI